VETKNEEVKGSPLFPGHSAPISIIPPVFFLSSSSSSVSSSLPSSPLPSPSSNPLVGTGSFSPTLTLSPQLSPPLSPQLSTTSLYTHSLHTNLTGNLSSSSNIHPLPLNGIPNRIFLSSSSPSSPSISSSSQERKIRLTFLTPPYSEWNNQEQQSQLVTAFGRKWYISIEPKTKEGKDYLACYVHKRHGDEPIRGHINYIELVDRKTGDPVVSNSMADGLFKLFSDDPTEFPAWGWDNFTSLSYLKEKNAFTTETGQTLLLRAELLLHSDDV